MKKKNLILSIIIFFTSIIISFLYFYYSHYLPGLLEEKKYSKDIERLYSSFTEVMKHQIDYRLKSISCEPKEYYFRNSDICFVCSKIYPCFSYNWVELDGGKKRNLSKLPYLMGNYSNEDMINFYSFGITKLLGCQCNGDCVCRDGIKVKFDKRRIIFLMPKSDIDYINSFILNIAKALNIKECFKEINIPSNTFIYNRFIYCGNDRMDRKLEITWYNENEIEFTRD
jgi:hypothetical protein